MGIHHELQQYDPSNGFTLDEYNAIKTKYSLLSPLLKQYCNHMAYEISNDGVLRFSSRRGNRYEVLFFTMEECQISPDLHTFGALYRNNSQRNRIIYEPIDIINFMLRHCNRTPISKN